MKPEQYINFAKDVRAYRVPDDNKIFICAFDLDNVHNAEFTLDIETAESLIEQLKDIINKK